MKILFCLYLNIDFICRRLKTTDAPSRLRHIGVGDGTEFHCGDERLPLMFHSHCKTIIIILDRDLTVLLVWKRYQLKSGPILAYAYAIYKMMDHI